MRTNYTAKDVARFWGKVNKRGSDKCWIWNGTKTKWGYGYLTVQGKTIGAHVFSFVLEHGDTNLCVLHECDNPSCVNPYHLFDGTHSDNLRDARNKGRWFAASGENSGRHKLTAAQVSEIRLQYSQGKKSQAQLAHEFGVKPNTVSNVVNGKTWK